MPAELLAEATALRTALLEAAAEADDELLGRYLEAGTLTEEELRRGLAAGARARKFLPVAVAAAKTGLGVRELLDLAVLVFPSPAERVVAGTDLGGKEAIGPGSPTPPSAARSSRPPSTTSPAGSTTSASSPARSSPRPR